MFEIQTHTLNFRKTIQRDTAQIKINLPQTVLRVYRTNLGRSSISEDNLEFILMRVISVAIIHGIAMI